MVNIVVVIVIIVVLGNGLVFIIVVIIFLGWILFSFCFFLVLVFKLRFENGGGDFELVGFKVYICILVVKESGNISI